jgi:hypothetical protein
MPAPSSPLATRTTTALILLVALGLSACGSPESAATQAVGASATTKLSKAAASAQAVAKAKALAAKKVAASAKAVAAKKAAVAAKAAAAKAATATAQKVLAGVVLNASDLRKGYTLKLNSGGDQLAGHPSAYCGYKFTTDPQRTARHEIVLLTPKGEKTGISEEVVAYESSESATKALSELRASVMVCETGVFKPTGVRGEPDWRYDVSKVSPLPSLPVKDNALVEFAVSGKGTTNRIFGVAVFQRQGKVLDTVVAYSGAEPTAADVATITAMATIPGKRLAKL